MLADESAEGRICGHSPEKVLAMLRVHNIPKKVHTASDIFPFILSATQKQHIGSVSAAARLLENVSEVLRDDINRSENLICCPEQQLIFAN